MEENEFTELQLKEEIRQKILLKMNRIIDNITDASTYETDLKICMSMKSLSDAYNNLIDMEEEL